MTPIRLTLLLVPVLAMTACRTHTQNGALMGGAMGAGTGAAIAAIAGESVGGGALIGAGVGAISGGVIGNSIDRARSGVVWDGPAAYSAPVSVVHSPVVVRRPVIGYRPTRYGPPGPPPPPPIYRRGLWTWSGTGWVWIDR